MRHRRILDVARQNPDASVDDLASMVPSATPDLVEHVFEEHGDPAAEEESPDASTPPAADSSEGGDAADGGPTDAAGDGTAETVDAGAADSESDCYPEPGALSEKQRDVLAIVAAEPTATQQEIGERVGVSRATVNKRVNGIEGFEWSERESFVDAVFDEPPAPGVTTDGGSTAEPPSTDTDEAAPTGVDGDDPRSATAEVGTALADLEGRVAALEAARDGGSEGSAFDDPDLVHKVVHACMDAETISEAEELRILRALLE
ncbi:winged helix-turn-helix domain-containing protein [Halorientalis pallida]|uniref:Winged helix-turn-helix domain-containing protein n=2 Tax=Halorientalis pallida TaxID=2479928 RepID=A0A498KYU0_9EURY|nr:winged helix-turn-helix domain-containing protein [Halorientalis pallida]